jgi:hypothetical protein
MTLVADPEAAFATIAPAFLFRFDHSEGMRTGEAPGGDWELWLQAINRMPQDALRCLNWRTSSMAPVQAVDGVVRRAGCSAQSRCHLNGWGC